MQELKWCEISEKGKKQIKNNEVYIAICQSQKKCKYDKKLNTAFFVKGRNDIEIHIFHICSNVDKKCEGRAMISNYSMAYVMENDIEGIKENK